MTIPGIDKFNHAFGYHAAYSWDSLLFLGTDNFHTGCEVWAYDPDDSTGSTGWTQINEDRFGAEGIAACSEPGNCNVLTRASRVHRIEGRDFLFVGTGSNPWKINGSACQLWVCELTSRRVERAGFRPRRSHDGTLDKGEVIW